MAENHQSCIQACLACAAECNHCAAACLREDDVKAMARCIALDIDCAELCALAAAVMARGGAQARALCAVCADACQACGEECTRHAHAHCKSCAAACLRCAKECRQMATTA